MDKLVVNCPSCSVRITLNYDRAGTTLECPKCDRSICVPVLLSPLPPLLPPKVVDSISDEGSEGHLQLKLRKRGSPMRTLFLLVVAGAVVFGALIWAISGSSREPEKTVNALKISENESESTPRRIPPTTADTHLSTVPTSKFEIGTPKADSPKLVPPKLELPMVEAGSAED